MLACLARGECPLACSRWPVWIGIGNFGSFGLEFSHASCRTKVRSGRSCHMSCNIRRFADLREVFPAAAAGVPL